MNFLRRVLAEILQPSSPIPGDSPIPGPMPVLHRRRLDRRDIAFLLALVLLFVGSFTLPIVFGLKFDSLLRKWRQPVADSTLVEPFESGVTLRGNANYLLVKKNKTLGPAPGEDFLVSGWFLLDSLPGVGEELTLVSRHQGKGDQRFGYALWLEGEGSAVRPVAYWRDKAGHGGSFAFADQHLRSGQWFFLAMSVRNNRSIGIHFAAWKGDEHPEVTLLGGYDMGAEIVADANAEMRFGFSRVTPFRGVIGPIGIFGGPGLTGDLRTILRALTRERTSPPSMLPKNQVKLWAIDGSKDESPDGNRLFVVSKRADSQ